MGLLDDQVVIITGGAGGIGRAVARLFATEGAALVLNDRGCDRHGEGASHAPADEIAAELSSAGAAVRASYEDAATEPGARVIGDTAIEHFGRLDVWVNAAGIVRDRGLLSLELADLTRVMEVVVQSTFLGTRVAASLMKRNAGGGRIVNTTGIAGFLGNHGQAGYAAAAAAVYALTRTASIELQRYSIFVNAVAPIAKTRMTEDLPMFEHVSSMTPEHAAPAYLYFASRLSGDRSGSVLSVAGNKLSTYGFAESQDRFKEGTDPWTAEEMGEHGDFAVQR